MTGTCNRDADATTADGNRDDDEVDQVRRTGVGRWSTRARVAAALVVVWIITNVLWFEHNRGSRLWDHEEVGYVRGVAHFGRLRSGSSMWDALHAGYTGPIQALLGAPSQWLFGVREATVVWENIGLTAATGLLAFVMARRLADSRAGLVASLLVLVMPGMIENARGALTMVPATTFATLAMVAVVAGGGLVRWKWSVALGVAIGLMTLSRTMSIAFIPGLALPAVAWSLTNRATARVVVRNGAIAAAAAVAVSLWWWAISYRQVFDYLSVGSANVETAGPPIVLASRVAEMVLYVGPLTLVLAVAAYLVLARKARASASGSADADIASADRRSRWLEPAPPAVWLSGQDLALPLWPLWGAVAVALVASVASSTVGWLMLPLVPWVTVAAVAGVRRRFDPRRWRIWALTVAGGTVALAVASSVVWIKPGNRFTWCQEPVMNTSACPITSDAEAAPWRHDIDAIADETFDIHNALLTSGRPAAVAIAARDHIVLPSSIQLAAELRHRWDLDAYRFFPLDRSPSEQLDGLRREADIVIVSPDVEPVVLTKAMDDPDDVPGQLIGHGFADCRSVALPDGRVVRVIVREPLPPEVCDQT